MPPPRKGKVCLAKRAGIFLWIAAQLMSASTLPGRREAGYRAWRPSTESPFIADQPVRAFASAAATETLTSTLLSLAAKPEAPIELWIDGRTHVFHRPSIRRSDPLLGAQPQAWMLLAAATAFLTTVKTRHRRRRTHTGCRHTAELVIPIKKPRSNPSKRAERGCKADRASPACVF